MEKEKGQGEVYHQAVYCCRQLGICAMNILRMV